ncbi:MAG: C40 family peptidase [Steroidobacteraceae bacterium]
MTHSLMYGRFVPQLRALMLVACAALASACTPFRPGLPSTPVPRAEVPASATGADIAREARVQIGVPYLYGGADPRRGFDCSGLVSYTHAREGIGVPRTAAQQFAAARKLEQAALLPGDLVFFRTVPGSREITHVGIYVGQRRFVHAPQSGRDVSETSLDEPYYRERFAGAGRLYDMRGGMVVSPGSPPQ